MQVIDFERKGNVIRFYLGDGANPYYGDDWDDIPYEHNAGRVYDEFIKGHFDLVVPFDYLVIEPCEGVINSAYCKDDMRNRKIPCLILVSPAEINNFGGAWALDYASARGLDDKIELYFNDEESSL